MGQDPQRFFVQPPALPDDALGHEALARKLVGHAARLPPGSSIALQGPWGRGKTDVLWRIHTAAEQAEPIDGTRFVASIHINPWSYGEPDLLTPLVIKLLELIPPTRRANDKSIRMAAQTVIKSGLNFGMKAASYLVPAGGKLLEVAADPMSDLLAGLFEARDEQDNGELPDLDPVAAMRTRFCELCSAVVEAASDGTSDGRLLVVVDDLDRCLPSRQIALLEAVYFLANSSAGEAEIPPVNFVFAVDGLAVSRVVRRMFSASMMESQAYIDKLFDFKMHLAEMPNGAVSSLLRGRTPSRGLADAIDNALFLPSIRTARFAIRLAVASRAVLDDSQLSLEYSLEGNHNDQQRFRNRLIIYIVIALLCPEVRSRFQHFGETVRKEFVLQLVRAVDYYDNHPGDTSQVDRVLKAFQIGADAEFVHTIISLIRSAKPDQEFIDKAENQLLAAGL